MLVACHYFMRSRLYCIQSQWRVTVLVYLRQQFFRCNVVSTNEPLVPGLSLLVPSLFQHQQNENQERDGSHFRVVVFHLLFRQKIIPTFWSFKTKQNMFGTQITKTAASRRWGAIKSGVGVADDVVVYVKVVLGHSAVYKNVVERDRIYYCFSPVRFVHGLMIDQAETPMKDKHVFDVHVVRDANDFYYGKCVVAGFSQKLQCYELRRRNDSGTCDFNPVASRRARETTLDGHVYDSLLEAQYAVVLKSLCIPFVPHGITYILNDRHGYTPDMWVFMDGQSYVVEIKPVFPSADEIAKIETIVEKFRIAVMCVYGDVERMQCILWTYEDGIIRQKPVFFSVGSDGKCSLSATLQNSARLHDVVQSAMQFRQDILDKSDQRV